VSDFNPYAAPQFSASTDRPEHDPDEGRGVWRDGDVLVMAKIARLPMRCVKCNEPATNRLKRTLYYHHPAIYLIILANLLIYAIVAVIVRKSVKIEIPLCDDHRSRRRGAILLGWVLALSGLGICFIPALAEIAEPTPFILGGLVLFLFGLIYGMFRSQTVTPRKIDNTHAWIKKVSPLYLAELPPLPSPYEHLNMPKDAPVVDL